MLTGKYSAGILVKNKRKFSFIDSYLSAISSNNISKAGIYVLAKWQFYNKTQFPSFFAYSIKAVATLPYPYPKDIGFKFYKKSLSFAKFITYYVGSAPEDNTKIIGVLTSESLYTSSILI